MTTSLTERQLDLITRAHSDAGGLIEPLLDLKGGAKLKMIDSLAQRGLIEQLGGQWRLTPKAVAIIQGEAQPEEALSLPDQEAAVTAAEAAWTQPTKDAPRRTRQNSKQAQVIAMLRRPEGATIHQIREATGWQAHTVRGTLAGALKKKLGLAIVSEKPKGGERVYRIV